MQLCDILQDVHDSVDAVARRSPERVGNLVRDYAPFVSDEKRRELSHQTREAMGAAYWMYSIGSAIVRAGHELYCGEEKTIATTQRERSYPVKIYSRDGE